jgi:hypothetical protein
MAVAAPVALQVVIPRNVLAAPVLRQREPGRSRRKGDMRGIVLAAILVLAGCANVARQRLEARLGELVGSGEAELVRRVGVPARVYNADGRRFLAYVELWPDVAYTPWTGFGYGFGGRHSGVGMAYGVGSPQFIDRFCEATFEVAAGRVVAMGIRGNSCGWSGWPLISPPQALNR